MFYNAKETHQIIHKDTNYALQTSEDVIHKTNQVEMGPINPHNKRQLWLLEGREGASVQIINGFTDHVLTEDIPKVQLKRGTASRHQLWKFQFIADHQFRIRKAKSTNQYVCLNKGQLSLKQTALAQADIWTLQAVKNNPILNKSCFIISKDNKKLIDIPESSHEEGTQLALWEGNYRYTQRWNILRAGEIYVIKSHFNQLNIDIKGEKIEEGTDLIQWQSHGKVNQFWLFQKVGERQYRICSCFDRQLQIGHHHNKLQLHKGRKFTWIVEGYFPE